MTAPTITDPAALVAAFREANTALSALYRGSDSQAIIAAREKVDVLAVQLRDAVADRHHIEESAKVYLVLAADGWTIDSPTDDGYPLEGYEDGATDDGCEHDPAAHWNGDEAAADAECEALRAAALYLPLPDARELAVLLAEHLR